MSSITNIFLELDSFHSQKTFFISATISAGVKSAFLRNFTAHRSRAFFSSSSLVKLLFINIVAFKLECILSVSRTSYQSH
ncbi:hypothetical protein HOF65_07760 [bacterium]|nr:hypothetical protein [bacterium]MBT3853790.1 hypothetical protein [bacterium]MBT4632764.1 hypothetical protein [bacterium]MBT6779359.1 hypothetical protein [bacterium]